METDSYQIRVAAEVRAGIARAGLKATEIAKATGYSKATLSRKLAGDHPFNTIELYSIARVIGVQPSAFLPSVALAEERAAA